MTLHLLGEVASTNDEAKRGAAEGAAHGTAWVARSQTKGRGRQGRAWLCEPGDGLLFSVLLRLAGPPANRPLVGLAAGLAVRDAVGLGAMVKWPNDVVVRGRKLAGVLLETAGDAIVCGVGVNVRARRFPPELADRATSIALELGASAPLPDDRELLGRILERLLATAERVAATGLGALHARLSAADALRGQLVRTDGGLAGVADGIDERGRLLVRSEDGILHRLGHGEVHLV